MPPLHDRSPSKHNQMLNRFFVKHQKSTKFDSEKSRPAKRQRRETPDTGGKAAVSPSRTKSKLSPSKAGQRVVHDSKDEEEDLEAEIADVDVGVSVQKTDLESALPPVCTDKEVIQEYEAFKSSQTDEKNGAEERLMDKKWVKGKSSIYVDAFNLALDTVLDEESHLFDEAEMSVFRQWKELGYEAQYL